MDTDLHPLLNRILRALGEPLMLEDLEIKITASIGCVVIDGNQSSATELIQHAEEAMYLVKSGQRRGFCIADKEIIQTFQTRRNFDSKIRECVQKNRFRLHYQPIVDTESGKLFGAEALLRIQEKDGSMLAASDFITALQRTRFLPIVDEWVLAQTIHTFKEIAKPLLGIQGFRFSVNVSPSILSTKGYAKLCLEQLDQAGVPPDSLMLEIVESNLISAKQGLLENLQILRAKGVKIAVDDFGTGYSNLQQLTTLPIDIIKIDQMFLETSLTKESVKKTLLTTIVGIGKSLGYTLIAEGVENQAQAEQVKALGCRYVQGYFYGKPMPIEELLEFAKKQT
jgi:EAL domain-containing protein (putative c-di-GMP-specific phosphodiesterase class I)